MPEIVAFGNTLKAIKKFAPDLNKKMNRDINKSLNTIVKDAQGFIPEQSPLRNWTQPGQGNGMWASRAFDREAISAGIRKTRAGGTRRTREGLVTAYAILDKTAAGVMLESAGTKTAGKTKQGQIFVQRISAWMGLPRTQHKLIVRSLIKNRPIVVKDIENTIDATVREFNNRMESTHLLSTYV